MWGPTRRMQLFAQHPLETYTHTHTHTPTHAPTHSHTRTHSHSHTHSHTLTLTLTQAHAHTHTHTVLDGHCMARSTGCRDVWLLRAGGHSSAATCSNVHGWAAGPLRHAVEVRGRSLLQQQGALRASAIARACCMPPCSCQLTSRPGIHAACITPPQVHPPSGATTARLRRTRTDPKAVGF
jgi:hypothetical protein